MPCMCSTGPAGFYVLWQFFGLLEPQVQPRSVLYKAAQHLCARSWEDVNTTHGHFVNLEKYCLVSGAGRGPPAGVGAVGMVIAISVLRDASCWCYTCDHHAVHHLTDWLVHGPGTPARSHREVAPAC